MTLTLAVALNVLVAASVVAALAYICRIPYRLDRVVGTNELLTGSDERLSSGYERAAA